MKTKTMTRWLAMVLCVITLFTLLMPAVSATENDAEPSEEPVSVNSETNSPEEASPTSLSSSDEEGIGKSMKDGSLTAPPEKYKEEHKWKKCPSVKRF